MIRIPSGRKALTYAVIGLLAAMLCGASAGQADASLAQQTLDTLSQAPHKNLVVAMDVSGSTTKTYSGQQFIASETRIVNQFVATLHAGDTFSLMTFDSQPEWQGSAITIPDLGDVANAQQKVNAYFDGGQARLPHPQYQGTNIRWAHYEILQKVLNGSQSPYPTFCVFITDGKEDPVKDTRSPNYEEYATYYAKYGGPGVTPGLPVNATTDDYKRLCLRAKSEHINFSGIGVDFTSVAGASGYGVATGHDVDPKEWLDPHYHYPVPPRTFLEQLMQLPWWAKGLILLGLALAAFLAWMLVNQAHWVALRRSGDLKSEPVKARLSPAGKHAFMAIGGDPRAVSAYSVPVGGTNAVIAHVVAKPFGKFVLQPLPIGADAGRNTKIELSVNDVRLIAKPVALEFGNAIQAVVHDMTSNIATPTTLVFEVK